MFLFGVFVVLLRLDSHSVSHEVVLPHTNLDEKNWARGIRGGLRDF